MKFKIIPNEQTPNIIQDNHAWLVMDEDEKLLTKFVSFARRQHNCVGLASNQVSCDGERIMKPFFVMKPYHTWDIIINPIITSYKGETREVTEGCLTWLGKKIQVSRNSEIDVIYSDIKGKFIERTLIGYEAQIFQHEYNHLKGVEEKFI